MYASACELRNKMTCAKVNKRCATSTSFARPHQTAPGRGKTQVKMSGVGLGYNG